MLFVALDLFQTFKLNFIWTLFLSCRIFRVISESQPGGGLRLAVIMFLTPIYIAMTFLKTWRVRSFRDKLLQFLGGNSSVAFYKVPEDVVETPTLSSKLCIDTENANLCELLDYSSVVRVCSMKPNQVVNLSSWIPCSKSLPFKSTDTNSTLELADINILIECDMEQEVGAQDYKIVAVETIGDLIAWRAEKHLALLLKTNIENLSIIGSGFVSGDFIINYKLPVVRIQTVLLEGEPHPVMSMVSKQVRSQLVKSSNTAHQWQRWSAHANLLRHYSTTVLQEPKLQPLQLTSHKSPNANTKSAPVTAKSLDKSDAKPVMNVEPTPKITSSNHTSPNKPNTSSETVELGKEPIPPVRAKKNNLTLDLKPVDVKKPVTNVTSEKTHTSQRITSSVTSTPRRLVTQKATEAPISLSANSTPKKTGGTPSAHSNGSAGKGVKNANRPLINTKSPNVLIYSDSKVTGDNIESMLRSVLDCNRYTVYTVNSENIESVNTSALAVIAGDVSPHAASLLSEHFLAGGKMFAICSDLLHSILPYYKTAEVRENEVVQFSYEQWHSVRMKHHIFCYQASPAKKQFSTESDKQSAVKANGSAVVPSKYNGHQGHELEVEVLASEETWRTPSLLQATDSKNKGIAVFSQIHLEADPSEYLQEDGPQTNEARLGILRRILGGPLGLHLAEQINIGSGIDYSKGYFLGNHVHKLAMIDRLCEGKTSEAGNPFVRSGGINIDFYCAKGKTAALARHDLLPVMVHECPEHFSTLDYFDNLFTEHIGRLVLYSDVLTSSQNIIRDAQFQHGFIVVPRRQTAGVGRGGNTWLSPEGCAMLSLQLIYQNMGSAGAASRLQHLAAVSVVHSIRSQPGYDNLDIRIKWPNDIYYKREVKLGGATADASCDGREVIVNMGVGFNLDNTSPTTCLNDIIRLYNHDNNKNLNTVSLEVYLARFCNVFEMLYSDMIEGDRMEKFYELYYKYWLHSNEAVKVQREGARDFISVRVTGIDHYGFLKVITEKGESISVQPDGNTFDMMAGLIAPKSW